MIPYLKQQIRLARFAEGMLSLMSSASDQNGISEQPNFDSLSQGLLDWRMSLPEWAEFKSWDPIDHPLKPSIAAIQYARRESTFIDCDS